MKTIVISKQSGLILAMAESESEARQQLATAIGVLHTADEDDMEPLVATEQLAALVESTGGDCCWEINDDGLAGVSPYGPQP